MTSTNGGMNFWIGNNPAASGEYIWPLTIDEPFVRSIAGLPESARDEAFYAHGLEFIQNSPVQSLELFGRKLVYFLFFRPNIGSNYEQVQLPVGLAGWLFILSWLALLPFALLGLLNLGNHWREHVFLMVIFVCLAIMTSIYFAGTRFRVPIDGFVMLWAVVGVNLLVTKYKSPARNWSLE